MLRPKRRVCVDGAEAKAATVEVATTKVPEEDPEKARKETGEVAEGAGEDIPASQVTDQANYTQDVVAEPTTDPIFPSFNTPEKALVAYDNKSFTGINPKIISSVKEVKSTT